MDWQLGLCQHYYVWSLGVQKVLQFELAAGGPGEAGHVPGHQAEASLRPAEPRADFSAVAKTAAKEFRSGARTEAFTTSLYVLPRGAVARWAALMWARLSSRKDASCFFASASSLLDLTSSDAAGWGRVGGADEEGNLLLLDLALEVRVGGGCPPSPVSLGESLEVVLGHGHGLLLPAAALPSS